MTIKPLFEYTEKGPEVNGEFGERWTEQVYRANRRLIDDLLHGKIRPKENSGDIKDWLEEYFIQELLQEKSVDPELQAGFISNPKNIVAWRRLIQSFGIGEDSPEEKVRNYISWVGKKLLLPHEQYDRMSIDEVDNLMFTHLSKAIEMCRNIYAQMGISEGFKSANFDAIHNCESIWELLEIYSLIYGKIHKGKNNEDIVSEDGMRKLSIALFEIIRILAMLKNILMWEFSPGNHMLKDDTHFLVKKVASLTGKVPKEDEIDINDNPFYGITSSHPVHWKKEGDKYLFSDEVLPGYEKIILEGITLTGKLRAPEPEKSIELLHIGFRANKNVLRSVEKRQRKNLPSMEEILDKKGFQFVVSSVEDKAKLIKLLEYELSTQKSGWLEAPSDVSNPNTDPDYHCLKGTLLVPHKLKAPKEQIESALRDISGRHGKKKAKKGLSPFLERPPYNIPVEIQIFTLEEFIKAEYDETSPVFHGIYEKKQRLELIPKLFPPEIYGREAILSSKDLSDLIAKKVQKVLNKIL